MKKKILFLVAALMLFVTGVASGATLWGTYKGNEIIRLTVNGNPVKVSDVPAISYNDRTMIPIYLLKQAGISYTWDAKYKTVNIVTSRSNTQTQVPNANTTPLYPLYLYSYDLKTYLGKLTTNQYDSDSIFNEYGDYGSEYSQTSIWNEYGDYGGQYNNQGIYNKYATEPPAVVENGNVIGYITKNTSFEYRVDPDLLYTYLTNNGYTN